MSRRILIVIPSVIAAKGLEQVFADLGEFEVCGILQDLPGSVEIQLRTLAPDIIIADPSICDFSSRGSLKTRIAEYTDAAVLAFATQPLEEDILKQFDGCIGLLDPPTAVIRKVRTAMEQRSETPRSEGEELSQREKEILICVAKGMLNKEIADLYNISIYTVITHRKNITRKTGIKTVAGLTVYALLNNLIDMNSVE
ncbi:MAG: response regulator transcription factor [Bacteroidales bacterium]|nr:response regulator transcription factor [Bacteroidales bacterium]